MRIQGLKYSVSIIRQTVAITLLFLVIAAMSGCGAVGFLLSPGWAEEGMEPDYDLHQQQDRKVMILVECPRSIFADHDFSQQMSNVFNLYLTVRAKFDPENIIISPADTKSMTLNPLEIARSQGAGYVLIVHVDKYEVDFLQIRNYYAGELVVRSALLDVDLGQTVWPVQRDGKMVHIQVEMETEGREALVTRMVTAAAHCTLRNLYHCDKLTYKHLDERISAQEAFEIETY